MSVRRLLEEMDSAELSAWQVFMRIDAEHQQEMRRQAAEDRALLGDEET